MVASALQLATRAFVRTLLALAAQYSVTVAVNRDSSAAVLLSAYRRLLKKVHPDKGGRTEDQQNLQTMKEDWERARKGPKAMIETWLGTPTKAHGCRQDGLRDIGRKKVV